MLSVTHSLTYRNFMLEENLDICDLLIIMIHRGDMMSKIRNTRVTSFSSLYSEYTDLNPYLNSRVSLILASAFDQNFSQLGFAS